MSIRNYIENARNQAMNNYAGFTGVPAASNGGYSPSYRNYVANTPPFPARTYLQQTGAGQSAGQSQPYIITVSNASATAVSNFDVLGAYTYLNGGSMSSTPAGTLTFSSGTATVTGTGFGITITSAITNVNYQQFLYQSMNQPFSVGLTYIEAVSGGNAQVTQTFTLNTQDANGNQMLRTIVPVIDPYQQQTGIVAIKQLYSIDGFTKLTFATINASAVFRVHFYPASNINLAAGLNGQPVANQYGNPMISAVPTNIVNG